MRSLIPALLALLVLVDTRSVGPADAQIAGGARDKLPLVDAHIHYSAPDWSTYTPDGILAILDQAGIKRALVSSTPDDGTLTLHAKAPSRVIPMLRPYRTRDDMSTWWNDPTIIPYLEERLRRRVHRGIGEFHLSADQTGTAVIKRIAEIAVKDNLVLQSHSDDATIVALYRVEPRLTIIWAHAGMSSGPGVISRLLDRYPTLSTDLSLRNGDVAPGGTLDPEWRALFLRHPDRFLVGTDTWVTSRWSSLPGSIDEVRHYLGQLPRDVAEKIAFRNADRLFP